MSSREHEITQLIADLISSISAQSNLSIEEAMNFVYNSETLNKITDKEEPVVFDVIKEGMMNELRCG